MQINTSFSTWTDLIIGLPKASVLGPLFLNIYLNDLFFFLQDINICNFADETTPFVCHELGVNSELAIFWFEKNHRKLNTDKCSLGPSIKYVRSKE